MMTVTPLNIRPITVQGRKPASPQPKIRFGACVNRATQAAEATDMIIKSNLRERLHIIAELGRNAATQLVGVLADLITGKNEFQKIMAGADEELKKVALASALEALEKGDLSAADKEKLLKALKEALQKGFMNKQKQLIQDIIHRVESGQTVNTEAIKDAIHRQQHASGGHHHHHGDGGHHHH